MDPEEALENWTDLVQGVWEGNIDLDAVPKATGVPVEYVKEAIHLEELALDDLVEAVAMRDALVRLYPSCSFKKPACFDQLITEEEQTRSPMGAEDLAKTLARPSNENKTPLPALKNREEFQGDATRKLLEAMNQPEAIQLREEVVVEMKKGLARLKIPDDLKRPGKPKRPIRPRRSASRHGVWSAALSGLAEYAERYAN